MFQVSLTPSVCLVGIFLSMPLFAAPSNGQFYSKIDLNGQVSDVDGTQFTEIKSNNSWIGVKGDYALSHDLALFYRLEWKVDITQEKGQQSLTERPQYLGLRGGFGEMTIGRNFTAVRNNLVAGDLFNHYEGDIVRLWQGENRLSDMLTYQSPALLGVKLNVTYQAEQEAERDSQTSVRLFYGDERLTNAQWYAGFAHDFDVEGFSTSRLHVRRRFSTSRLSLAWQNQKNEQSGESDAGYFVSYAYQIGQLTLEAQAQSLADNRLYTLGGEYAVAESTDFFAWLSNKDLTDQRQQYFIALGIQHRIQVKF